MNRVKKKPPALEYSATPGLPEKVTPTLGKAMRIKKGDHWLRYRDSPASPDRGINWLKKWWFESEVAGCLFPDKVL